MKEKMAVLLMTSSSIKYMQIKYSSNGYFVLDNVIEEKLNIMQDVQRDGYIKPLRIEDTIQMLRSFKSILAVENITQVVCIADRTLNCARNQMAFFDEIYKTLFLDFKIIKDEDSWSLLHNAVLHTMAVPKGVIVNVENDYIHIIKYTRRTIVEAAVLDFGILTLANKYIDIADPEKKMSAMESDIAAALNQFDWLKTIEQDYEFIGIGTAFEDSGKLSRKLSRYPIDIAHNYVLNTKNFLPIYNLIKTLDIDKTKKLKGISANRADVVASGIAVIKSFFSTVLPETISVCVNELMYGAAIKHLFSNAQDRPLVDVLGYSLSTIAEFYDNGENISFIYDTSILLYRQLKVLHKLNKNYAKILRIAACMSLSGKRIAYSGYEKSCFNIVLNSNICGATHKEIVMAAFVAGSQNVDDFNVQEWVRFKDIVQDEEVENIKRLAVMIKLSMALCCTGEKSITDVTCDILGDTVILKTAVNKSAILELAQANARTVDFKKVYKKNLQIL